MRFKDQFNPKKREYSSRNYVNVVEYYIPGYYKDEDIRLHGTQTEVFSQFINSHLRIADNISTILPLSDGTLHTGLDTLSGISKFFIKQNRYSLVEPKDFEFNILNLDNKTFKDFNTSAEFQEYIADTLIPKIQTNSPTLSSIDYLIDNLGWFYFLAGSSQYSYQPSTTVVEAFNTLYRGGSLDINDGINCLSEFIWNNYSSFVGDGYIPDNYIPNSYLDVSNAYTSGTQNLDKIKVINDVLYSTYLTDIQDEKVKDAFEVYGMVGSFLTDKESAGPFHRLLKAFSLGFTHLQDPINTLNTIYDINNCPENLLEELARLIGWKLYGYDKNKWRLQLINAVSIYKNTGTKQSLQAALDSIFSPGIVDLDSYLSELWESYIPFLMMYALATESELLTSLDTYTRDIAYKLNVDTYSTKNIEENIYIIIDNIIGRLLEEFPELFGFPKDDPNFVFSYRGRTLNFPPFEEISYYTKCDVNENLILRLIDYLVCFGVRLEFAEQVGNYIRNNVYNSNDNVSIDSSWLIFTSGHEVPPNWDRIIQDTTKYKEEYLSLWSGKSSHYKLIFNASQFNFLNKSLNSDSSREIISLASQVANDFSPAHAVQHASLVLSDADVETITSVEDGIVVFDHRDYSDLVASSNSMSNSIASGIKMASFGASSGSRADFQSITKNYLSTTEVSYTPRNIIRNRNNRNTFNLGGFYDRTGFNSPISFVDDNFTLIELSRNEDGILHIDTEGDMKYGYYGLGYAHGKDLGDLYLLKYILHSGRGLQYFSDNFPTYFSGLGLGNILPGTYKFGSDGTVTALGSYSTTSLSSIVITQNFFNMIEDAEEAYESMPYRYKQALDYYTKGLNRSLQENKARLEVSSLAGPTLSSLGAFDFRVSPVDVILATTWFTAEGTIKNALTRTKAYVDGTQGDVEPPILMGEFLKSSNQWACRGTITDTGRPINLIDPHLPTPIGGDFSYLIVPSVIRTSDWEWAGGGPVGTLFMALGGNRHLSYSLTANSPLHLILYYMQYSTGQYRTSRTSGFTNKVNRTISIDTTGSPISYTFYHTTHGPMLYQDNINNIAVTVAHNFRKTNKLLQFMQMADSKTLDQFNLFYGKLHSLGYNCVVATNEGEYGNIQYCHGGRVRKMVNESIEFRTYVQNALDTSSDWITNLSTNEPSYNLDAFYYSFFNNEVPILRNPDAGYVVCNNASPSLVTSGDILSNADYPKSMIVSNDEPITNNRQNRARFLFDSTLSSGGQITFELSKEFSLDKYADIYPRNVAYWSSIYDASADSFYTNPTDKNMASTVLTEWGLFDGSATLSNTVQPEIEFYYQVVVPLNIVTYSLDVSAGILSGLANWSALYDSTFGSLSINPPGERVQVSAGSVMRLAINLKTSPTDMVDLIPIAGGADALDSHGFAYIIPYNRFIHAGGIMFNMMFKYGAPGELPYIEYRFPSSPTTYINPSTREYAENYTSAMPYGFAAENYTNIGFSSILNSIESQEINTNELSSYVWKGFNISSLTFASAVPVCTEDDINLSAYDHCIENGTIERDYVVNSYPMRGSIYNNDPQYNNFYITRGELDPFIELIHRIQEKALIKYYEHYIEQNLDLYASTLTWKNLAESLANQDKNCLSSTFPVEFKDYYNAPLGYGINKWFDIYIKEFYRHSTAWPLLETPGPNIIRHSFGPLNENFDFNNRSSYNRLYASSIEAIQNLTPSHPVFISATSGAYTGTTPFKVGASSVEIHNSSIIPNWTLIQTSATSDSNMFTIFKLSKQYSEDKVFNNTLIKMKATNGFPRVRTKINGLTSGTMGTIASSNFLLPECSYTATIDLLAGNEDGKNLGGCSLGTIIRTKAENNKVWVFTKYSVWNQIDTSSLTKNFILNDLAHIHTFEEKDRNTTNNNKFNFLCISAISSSSTSNSNVGLFKDDEFTTINIKFNTNNKFIVVPYEYYNSFGQVHRKNQEYIIDLFIVPTTSDKFILLNSINIVNSSLNTLTKYEVTGTPTEKLYPKYCNTKYVDLTPTDMKVILDFYNHISGKGNGSGINSRDESISSSYTLDSGGHRASYREHPVNVDNSRHGTPPNDFAYSEIEI